MNKIMNKIMWGLLLFSGCCQPAFAEQIRLTVPGPKIAKVARQTNYENTVINSDGDVVPNPKTKLRHVEEYLKNIINDSCLADDVKHEGRAALDVVRQRAKESEDDVIISSGD